MQLGQQCAEPWKQKQYSGSCQKWNNNSRHAEEKDIKHRYISVQCRENLQHKHCTQFWTSDLGEKKDTKLKRWRRTTVIKCVKQLLQEKQSRKTIKSQKWHGEWMSACSPFWKKEWTDSKLNYQDRNNKKETLPCTSSNSSVSCPGILLWML